MICSDLDRYLYRSGDAWFSFWTLSAATTARDLDASERRPVILRETIRNGRIEELAPVAA